MSKGKSMSYREAAQTALDVQDACNLSGVVKSFADVTSVLWDEAERRREGTDWVNQHPICVLFIDKLSSLARMQMTSDHVYQAYDKCRRIAEGEVS